LFLPLIACAWGCSYDWRAVDRDAELSTAADAAGLHDAADPSADAEPDDDGTGAGDQEPDAAADSEVSMMNPQENPTSPDAAVALDASPVAASDAGTADAAGNDAGSAMQDAAQVDSGPLLFWYRDCDEDGYATSKVGRQQAATQPQETADCFGWTKREPADLDSTDCDDTRPYRHPGAAPGLPISLSGQALPPAGDIAYDLDCDGNATAQFTAWSTGNVRDGALERIELCPDTLTCVGRSSPCMLSFQFSGVPSCGVRYGKAADFACVSTPGYYFLCR
jgi:hypothetical protein